MLRSLCLLCLLTAQQDPGPANGNGYAVEGGLTDRLPASVLLLPEGGYAILVEKATQTLVLYVGTSDGVPRPLHIMRTNTGEKDGDKHQEGDLRTPEGIYFFGRIIDGRTLPAEYGVRAFTTDYPNIFDLLDGKDGSNIWLHATDEPERVWDGRNTRGCVVVTNEGLEILTPAINMGPLSDATPLIVREYFELLDRERASSLRDEMRSLLDAWAEAWESRDTDRYMSFYDRRFHGMGRDYATWKAYKNRLNNQYTFIDLELDDLRLYTHDDELVATFRQKYTSNYYQAVSEKRLYLRQTGGTWKIVQETGHITSSQQGVFQPAPQAAVAEEQPPETREERREEIEEAAPTRVTVPTVDEIRVLRAADVRQRVTGWEEAWESKDVDRYMSFYDQSFRGQGRDYDAWKAHKERLAGQYDFIEIDITNLTVSVQDDTAVVEFMQTYRSDLYTDTTRKSLHFRLSGETWKIVREEIPEG